MPRLLMRIFVLLGIALSLQAAKPTFQNGVHYVTLPSPLYQSSPGPVEVIEFFWYGCPHCYELEKNPAFIQWLSKNSKKTHFQRVPTSLGRKEGEVHARLYYVVESLFAPASEPIHHSIFNAFHKEHRLLITEPDLISFFRDKGISPKDFKERWDSYGVTLDVYKAAALSTKRYQILGVPTFVVDGRYLTEPSKASDIPTLVKILEFLVERARMDKTPSSRSLTANPKSRPA